MENLELVGWRDFECEYPTKMMDQEELSLVIQLIKEDIVKNNYMFSGEDHQNSITGVPVFSNGTCFRTTMRGWGSIMADLYKRNDGSDCSYMDFYMSLGENTVMPDYESIDIEAMSDCEACMGYPTKEDMNIVMQAIDQNIGFLTTDKVLKQIYERMKMMNEDKNDA